MSDIKFIDDLLDKSSDKEKQQFIEAQYRTILDLTKKNKKLQEEIDELKKVISSTNKLTLEERTPTIIDLQESDEVSIARMELRKLRERSFDEPLTLEETKKVEIFSKILSSNANKPKDISGQAKILTDKELLKLASELK